MNETVGLDIVHKIVAEEKRMTNLYSNLDTLVGKLRDIKPYLIKIAQKGRYATYRETANKTGVFTAR